MSEQSNDGIVNISGKDYVTVARRLADFRGEHPHWTIKTKLFEAAQYVRIRATVMDENDRVIGTGWAEENREYGNINKTSALENCETSAVGRAIMIATGKGGQHIRSAEEMEAAIEQQKEIAGIERLKKHNAAVRNHLTSILAIKQALAEDDFSTAYEAYAELPQDDWEALWMAPSKGGIWETAERGKFKSDGWNDARKAHHNIEEE